LEIARLKQIRLEKIDPYRQMQLRRAIWIAIVGNTILGLVKGFIAWQSNSSAIFSDAANSISDVLYSILMGIGLYLSNRPADESHPQGHSRFEPFLALLISITMAGAGIVAISQSIDRIIYGTPDFDLILPTLGLSASALVKVAMFVLMRQIGQTVRSTAIQATARDNLSDVITSLGAILGVWGANLIHPLLDPVAGILVALWIFRATWEIVSENLGYLTGRAAPDWITGQIEEITAAISGVMDVHRIVCDYVGPLLRVDMHIRIDGAVLLEEAHNIAEEVREKIEALPEIDLVFVHIDPGPKSTHSD
jgi:cation diffusion facilitator family transporter